MYYIVLKAALQCSGAVLQVGVNGPLKCEDVIGGIF